MNGLQRLILSIVPKRIAASIEEESRAWKMKCEGCGHAESVWESGGLRWKAKGSPRARVMCSACGKKGWHGFEREA